MTTLFLPSPPTSSFSMGPVTIHFYALCILAGIFLAWWLGQRRLRERGAEPGRFDSMMGWAVVSGIVGARVYHVITDHQLYFGPGRDPADALKIWNGGLGIWGAVIGGGLAVWVWCRVHRVRFGAAADAVAPALLLAQGVGRLGNWFNQELFGRPSTLPWALEIDPAHRPSGYGQYATFHPTFAYELVWDVAGGLLLLWASGRFRLGRGKTFTAYVAYYCLGRFFIEALRIDPANRIGGLRLNNWTSALGFALAVALLCWQLKRRPGCGPRLDGAQDAGERMASCSADGTTGTTGAPVRVREPGGSVPAEGPGRNAAGAQPDPDEGTTGRS
ncbi:prolipoprotein diacylglyceryl transferase [uncultured Propionibacterium sp.]|uniref:prolipoprotein diacylglyceryl transferase n=1 Tax=uncultured Propionibacterium sp. TaxID=218066 RepID=UPI0029307DC1|nr:prolipoprotein diacylglyceryl transferase [uncultured Propionibacterium sp.]